MLTIQNFNSSFLELKTSEESLIQTISDYFTFEIPSAQFHPAVRSHHWDGKIRLLQKGKYLYSGLKERLIYFLKQNNYSFQDKTLNNISEVLEEKQLREFIETIPLPLTLRDYQLNSVLRLLQEQRGLLVSPTASGKSLIFFLLIVCLFTFFKFKRIVLAVPTISLVQQMFKDFLDYSQKSSKLQSFFEKNTSLLYSETKKQFSSSSRLIIGTFASLSNLEEEFFSSAEAVLGDECHLLSKNYGKKIFEQSIHSLFRVGCTGTLQDTVLDKWVLEGLFGKPFQLIKTHELIKNQQATPVKVFPLVLHYSPKFIKKISSLDYQEEYETLVSLPKRIEKISSFALELPQNTLILFTRISQQGDLLFSELSKQAKEKNKELIFITGNTEIEEREKAREKAESQSNLILICSYGVFAQGINIKNIHNIIFASPYKTKIKILQSIGRGLRLHESKKTCFIYDFVDDCRMKDHQNYFFKHFLQRLEIYEKEQFEVDIIHDDELVE